MLVRLVRLVQLSVGRNTPSNADRDASNAGKNALSIAYGDLIAKKACLEMHGKMFIIIFLFLASCVFTVTLVECCAGNYIYHFISK